MEEYDEFLAGIKKLDPAQRIAALEARLAALDARLLEVEAVVIGPDTITVTTRDGGSVTVPMVR